MLSDADTTTDQTRIQVASALITRWTGTVADEAELVGVEDGPLAAALEAQLVRLDTLRAILTGHIPITGRTS